MRTVLEGATTLSSVNRETQGLVAGANVDLGVVLDGGNDALSTAKESKLLLKVR